MDEYSFYIFFKLSRKIVFVQTFFIGQDQFMFFHWFQQEKLNGDEQSFEDIWWHTRLRYILQNYALPNGISQYLLLFSIFTELQHNILLFARSQTTKKTFPLKSSLFHKYQEHGFENADISVKTFSKQLSKFHQIHAKKLSEEVWNGFLQKFDEYINFIISLHFYVRFAHVILNWSSPTLFSKQSTHLLSSQDDFNGQVQYKDRSIFFAALFCSIFLMIFIINIKSDKQIYLKFYKLCQLICMKESDIEIPKFVLEKAEAAKKYIQKKYNMNQLKAEQKAENWKNFQQKLKQMQLTSAQQENIKKQVIHEQMQQFRRKRQKMSRMCFESLAIIGRGAFGQVRLCRELKNGRIVAIKCLKKKQMIKKNQQAHLRDERNILVDGCEWIVKLLYSFQDQTYLYLVMQFLAGGDLMTQLIEKNVISENEAKFYAAQAIVAIDCIHKMGYIHRDLKPDNILIDSTGHIKLSDFGLCKQADINNEDYYHEDMNKCRKMDFKSLKMNNQYNAMIHFKKKDRKLAFSAVGTPDYIAPEMLTRKGYSQTVDWWSIGIMIYEMLIGYAPFSAETNEEIYYKIQHHNDYLFFPPQVDLSEDVIDLISRLVIDEGKRLGNNGVAEIQKHKWFRSVNWVDLKKMKPPFVPDLKSQIDVKYFDKYQEKEPWLYNPNDPLHKKDFNFIGYTYKEQENNENDGSNIYDKALQKVEAQKIQQIQKEKAWLDMLRNNMKKKKTINLNDSKNDSKRYNNNYVKKPTEKTIQRSQRSGLSINNKSQLYTDRSRYNMTSKSPLGEKDLNSKRKTTTKTTLETQKSSSILRKTPTVPYASTLFQQTQPIQRKSLNTRK